MSRPSLAALFAPRAVAIVGASADPTKVGGSAPRGAAHAGRARARPGAGRRAWPAADHDAVADAIVRLAALMAVVPEIAELQVNPLIATPA